MNLAIVKYISEEVYRQGDGPLAVGHMAEAWEQAMEDRVRQGRGLTPSVIAQWGRLVCPEFNANGFRNGYVKVGGRACPPPGMVEYHLIDMLQLIEDGISPEMAYYNFELIHPFFDGNGRTGKILYNYLRWTLQSPEFPPDFFGGIRNP